MSEKLVKQIGHRVTTLGDKVTVVTLHEITLPESGTDKTEFDQDPAKYIEKILRQEGHDVHEVRLPKQSPLRLKPRYMLHIVYDNTGQYRYCQWIYIPDPFDPTAP